MNHSLRPFFLSASVLLVVSGPGSALEGTKLAQSAVKAQSTVRASSTTAKFVRPFNKTPQGSSKPSGVRAAASTVKVTPAAAKIDQTSEVAAAAVSVPSDAHYEPLAGKVRDYRTNPDASSWDALLRELRAFVAQPQTAHLAPAVLFAANPGLVDIGAKVTDFASGRIWSFPRVPESQHILLQWANVTPGAEEAVLVKGRRRIVRAAPNVSWRSELVHVPPGTQVKEARIVGSSQVTTVGKKLVRVDSPKALVIVGMDRSGNSYLHAFRASPVTWNEVADVFSGVPPYVLQSLSGKASFSGNDIILAIGSSSPAPPPTPSADVAGEKKTVPAASNGYRLVLKLVGGKYQMEGGKNGEDGAFATAAQFATALQQGRADIAKAWLVDPKLISIPKYIGYFSKPAPPPRLIPMANPLNGCTRYRLITSMKEDLILDVGRAKTPTFAVKAIFIAPPDPLASRILSNLQAHDSATTGGNKEKDKDN